MTTRISDVNTFAMVQSDSKITGTIVLDDATGNEAAFTLNYTTNKATSGNDTGLLINMTDTASPGTSKIVDVQLGAVTRFVVTTAYVSVEGGSYFNSAIINASTISSASGALSTIVLGSGINTAVSGNINPIAITPTYNQASGTAANTDLKINRIETAVGSGAQLLIDAQVGGSSKFRVTNAGLVSVNGVQVLGDRVIDARCDDAVNSGDATTDGVIDALRDAMIAHGLIAAA